MPRLLIAGDVLGQFGPLFKRCEALNKSKAGPFDLILVAGGEPLLQKRKTPHM